MCTRKKKNDDDGKNSSSSESESREKTARIWKGWPPFDVRFCKFEMEQWLGACDIDVRNFDVRPDTLITARATVRTILSNIENER